MLATNIYFMLQAEFERGEARYTYQNQRTLLEIIIKENTSYLNRLNESGNELSKWCNTLVQCLQNIEERCFLVEVPQPKSKDDKTKHLVLQPDPNKPGEKYTNQPQTKRSESIHDDPLEMLNSIEKKLKILMVAFEKLPPAPDYESSRSLYLLAGKTAHKIECEKPKEQVSLIDSVEYYDISIPTRKALKEEAADIVEYVKKSKDY